MLPLIASVIGLPLLLGVATAAGVIPDAFLPPASLLMVLGVVGTMVGFFTSARRVNWATKVLQEWQTAQARRVLGEVVPDQAQESPSAQLVLEIRKRLTADDPAWAAVDAAAERLAALESDVAAARAVLAGLDARSAGAQAIIDAIDRQEADVARLIDELATLYAALLSGRDPAAATVADAVARLRAETEVRSLPREGGAAAAASERDGGTHGRTQARGPALGGGGDAG